MERVEQEKIERIGLAGSTYIAQFFHNRIPVLISPKNCVFGQYPPI
jgi:hypothetical protein